MASSRGPGFLYKQNLKTLYVILAFVMCPGQGAANHLHHRHDYLVNSAKAPFQSSGGGLSW